MADVQEKVAELRKVFLDKYSGSILDDTYDERDVNWVKESDALMRATINAYKAKGDVKKAADLLNEVLLYRAKSGINDLKFEDISQELRDKNSVYFKGKDKQGRDVLHFKVAKQRKGHLVEEGYKLIGYRLNEHYKANPEAQIAFIFDFHDAGVSNMDLDVTKFIVTCSNTYFPNIMATVLMFKMGLALEAIWKIIKGWLDAEQSKKTIFVKRSNIQDHIDASELEPHMIKEDKK